MRVRVRARALWAQCVCVSGEFASKFAFRVSKQIMTGTCLLVLGGVDRAVSASHNNRRGDEHLTNNNSNFDDEFLFDETKLLTQPPGFSQHVIFGSSDGMCMCVWRRGRRGGEGRGGKQRKRRGES